MTKPLPSPKTLHVRDEGSYRPNCQICLAMFIYKLSQFHKRNSFPLEPLPAFISFYDGARWVLIVVSTSCVRLANRSIVKNIGKIEQYISKSNHVLNLHPTRSLLALTDGHFDNFFQ